MYALNPYDKRMQAEPARQARDSRALRIFVRTLTNCCGSAFIVGESSRVEYLQCWLGQARVPLAERDETRLQLCSGLEEGGSLFDVPGRCSLDCQTAWFPYSRDLFKIRERR